MGYQGGVNRDTSGMGSWDRVQVGDLCSDKFLPGKVNCERRAACIWFQREHALDEFGWELCSEFEEETRSD